MINTASVSGRAGQPQQVPKRLKPDTSTIGRGGLDRTAHVEAGHFS